MASNIVSPSDFKAESVSVTVPRKKGERLQAYVLFNGAPAYCESPLSGAPFGVTSYMNKDNKNDNSQASYSVNLSISDEDYAEQLDKFDEMMIDYGVEHSKTIFGKQYNKSQRAVVEALYTRVLKKGNQDGDEKYPPRISPKIQRDRDDSKKPNILMFHSKDEEVEIESFDQLQTLIPKGMKMKAIFAFRIWFISGRFGVSTNVFQVLAPKRVASRPVSFAFNDANDVPKEHVEASDESTNDEADDNVEDSDEEDEEVIEVEEEDDDDDDEEEDEEEEPEPEPVVTKKKAAPRKKAGAKK